MSHLYIPFDMKFLILKTFASPGDFGVCVRHVEFDCINVEATLIRTEATSHLQLSRLAFDLRQSGRLSGQV